MHDEGTAAWLQANWADKPTCFTLDVEGAAIACRGWNLDAKDRPGLVLVHGFRAHAQWWDHIGPALAENHRVVALALSGMGDSGTRESYSREQHGREVVSVARKLGMAPATIVAHSAGALGCLLAARQQPEAIRRLIVIDSAIREEDEDNPPIPQRGRRFYPDRETAIGRFRLIPPGGWPNEAVLAYIARHSVMETGAGWTWKFDPETATGYNAEKNVRERMDGIAVPIDCIHGDRTEIMTAPRREELARLTDNMGRMVPIPACHHHVMIEQPAALTAAILGLLARDP